MIRKEFGGEPWGNVDPVVMDAILRVNAEPVDAWDGKDHYTKQAVELVQRSFREKIWAVMTVNGIGANIIGLKAMLNRHETVVCADVTHVNSWYEAGAFEFTLGGKILTAEHENGKLTVPALEKTLQDHARFGCVPRVVVLSQPTEFGTVYTVEELKAICDFSHARDMYVFVDGARLGYAIAALGTDLTGMIEAADIDAFTIGGGKAGAMFGDMVVFRREVFARNLEFIRKQSFQHFDKSKFLGVQMVALLTDDRWLENGRKANAMVKLLSNKLEEKGLHSPYPVESNILFVQIPEERMPADVLHYSDAEKKLVRFSATAEITEADVQTLVELF